MYIGDFSNNRIQILTLKGEYIRQFSHESSYGMIVTSSPTITNSHNNDKYDNIRIIITDSNRIRMLNGRGDLIREFQFRGARLRYLSFNNDNNILAVSTHTGIQLLQ